MLGGKHGREGEELGFTHIHPRKDIHGVSLEMGIWSRYLLLMFCNVEYSSRTGKSLYRNPSQVFSQAEDTACSVLFTDSVNSAELGASRRSISDLCVLPNNEKFFQGNDITLSSSLRYVSI